MILTLISLAEFEGVFKGLYFFSKGVFSRGPELMKINKEAHENQRRSDAAVVNVKAFGQY